ncbi:beta-N-acetylhexosaminidase [Cytophaga sp. FL35]|uniref:beta-N-acetylhexosaminidase n=1 Tax=Cytophaga sp. FL35 TaxID=1904456 RepID=UPI001653D8C4|nr:beta-N-acetylhexosaminidase [Cytophaga sp. FL35]MBC7000707.1 beta-N-acetylhexosaminidase [Cytophaga sp. FL35]
MNAIKSILPFVFILSVIQFSAQDLTVVPRPNSVHWGEGSFSLSSAVTIRADKALKNELRHLSNFLQKGFGEKPRENKRGGIRLKIDQTLAEKNEEGYQLEVSQNGIVIKGASPTGVFYGIQTFRQLLPPEFESDDKSTAVDLPSVTITDEPRFPWRAFMLDESRHFKGKETVKKLLDQMAYLKMNTFHWHLTDDQGWRIEIKKYPKLTEIGSFRTDTQAERKSELRTGEPHSGHYTQDDIKEIIAYAKERHINIVPEIEMPGHAMAAVAAYHWLGTLRTTKEVPVTFGKMDDSFDVTDPKVVSFLKDVLDEVMNLFPGQVVHIGGDEVNFEPWLQNEHMVEYMEAKHMKSPMDLQISFTNEISNYIDKAGKRMMGWNEILGHQVHEDRGTSGTVSEKLAPSAIVHFWKGDLSLVHKAVEEGYEVVNSNHWDTYLDYTYQRLPLEKSYAFDPVPEGLKPEYHSQILGLGTQMWSEWIPTVESMERQIFPRLAAYAEVGWTEGEHKDYQAFQNALEGVQYTWGQNGIHYHQEE